MNFGVRVKKRSASSPFQEQQRSIYDIHRGRQWLQKKRKKEKESEEALKNSR